MSQQVVMHRCSHCCKKVYYRKSSAERHEKRCYWNPASRACVTCEHLFDAPGGGHACYAHTPPEPTFRLLSRLEWACIYWRKREE